MSWAYVFKTEDAVFPYPDCPRLVKNCNPLYIPVYTLVWECRCTCCHKSVTRNGIYWSSNACLPCLCSLLNTRGICWENKENVGNHEPPTFSAFSQHIPSVFNREQRHGKRVLSNDSYYNWCTKAITAGASIRGKIQILECDWLRGYLLPIFHGLP